MISNWSISNSMRMQLNSRPQLNLRKDRIIYECEYVLIVVTKLCMFHLAYLSQSCFRDGQTVSTDSHWRVETSEQMWYEHNSDCVITISVSIMIFKSIRYRQKFFKWNFECPWKESFVYALLVRQQLLILAFKEILRSVYCV